MVRRKFHPARFLFMKYCPHPRFAISRLVTFVGISTLLAASAIAQAVFDINVEDRGQAAKLEVTLDEVQIKRSGEQPNGLFKMTAEAVLPEATVFEDDGSSVLVKFKKPLDRAKLATRGDIVTGSFPEAEVAPVLYVKGAVHNQAFRRVGTRDVQVILTDGRTPDQVKTLAGAQDVRRTRVNNVVILTFDNPYQAIDRSQALQAQGVRATPVLRRYMEKHFALPADQFFNRQWHLLNTGQNNARVGIDINALHAWDVTLGNNTTIAVVDDCLETLHPDLKDNCPPISSKFHHDFRDDDDDPKPIPSIGDFHGTSVSGLAAAAQSNGVPDINTGALLGVSGVAPNARLLGLRLIGSPVTDEETATALYWHPLNANVGVCNNSWGYGETTGLTGLEVLSKAALQDAATLGRDGRGQVTVFSAGNGRFNEANANFSTTSNSRFVTTVGALNCLGTFSSYSTPGASLLVCAPGGGFGTFGIEQRCTTTDVTGTGGFNPQFVPFDGGSDLPNIDYTNQMNGTSSAAPITSGAVALILAANPDLGWRDVKEILASTAKKVDETNTGWRMRPALASPLREVNEAGFKFNNDYGAGLIDAGAAVARSLTWANLGQEVSQTVRLTPPGVTGFIPDNGTLATYNIDFSAQQNLRAEQIEIELRINHQFRGDLRIELVSPAGTRSVLAVPRAPQFTFNTKDYADIVFTDAGVLDARSGGWTFSTTHHWGENTKGIWQIQISDQNATLGAGGTVTSTIPNGFAGQLVFAEMRLYGTTSGSERVVFDQQRYTITEPGVPTSQDIVVRRLGPTTSTFTVDYQTTVGSATPNSDFTPVSGTLTFNGDNGTTPGDVTKTISVPILPDAVPENIETINIVLTNLQGAGVSFGGTTMTSIDIIDDETQFVTVSATDSRAAETLAALPADPGTFLISRSKVTDQPLTVYLATSGTATPGNGSGDYAALPAQVVIPAFERAVLVSVQPYDDNLFEGSETVTVTIAPDPAYSVGVPGVDTITIVDNDRPKVQIASLNNDRIASETPTVPAPDTASFRITRDFVTDKVLTVFLRFAGTQQVGLNYKLTYIDQNNVLRTINDPLNSGVEIAPNQDHVDVTLTPLDDSIYQATKSAVIGLRPNDNYDFSFGFLTEITININEDDPKLDGVIPTVSITSPKSGTRFEAPTDVAIAGKAADNEANGLKRISYRVNGGVWTDLVGLPLPAQSIDWTLTLHAADLQLGLNTVEVRSIDVAINESKVALLKFTYVQNRTLTTTVTGIGSIPSGFSPSSVREAGSTIALTAKPGAGQVFDKWTLTPSGGPSSDIIGRTLSFSMPNADTTLVASFIPSPFVSNIAGNYDGLVKAAVFGIESSGFVHVTVAPTGVLTGKLTFAGQTYSLKGEFSGAGRYVGQVERKQNSPLAIDLQIDLNPSGTQRITGTVATPTAVSAVSANRAPYSKTAPAPTSFVKSYTLFFPQSLGAGLPLGSGNATMKIDASGNVSWTGRLPDGTTVKQTVPLTKDGTWPLFLNLYKKRGVMLGQVTHANLAGSDLSASLDWLRGADARAKYFPSGFTITGLGMIGSEYLPPSPGARVINVSAAVPNTDTKLDQGNLLAPIAQQITIDQQNKVTVFGTNTDKLSVKINTTTGALTGSFVHPVSNKSVKLNGVIFQKTNLGYGTFLGSSVKGAVLQTGTFTLTPIQ